MLDNGTPFELSAADAESQLNASIHIGSDYKEYSPASNGINIVVWDTQAASPVLQYSFDTSAFGPSAEVKAVMESRNGEINISVNDCDGIPGLLDMEAVIGDKTDTAEEKNVLISKNPDDNNYSGSVSMKGIKPEDLYVRVYGEDQNHKWWRIGTYNVSRKS